MALFGKKKNSADAQQVQNAPANNNGANANQLMP